MNYKEKYEKALEMARSYHNDPNCFKHMEGCLEHIFPELVEQKPAESGDIKSILLVHDEILNNLFERYKTSATFKTLIVNLQNWWNNTRRHLLSFNIEQKNVAWSEEDEQMIRNVQNDYHNRLGAGIIPQAYHDKVISWLKSLSFKNKWNDVSVPPKFPCDILFRYPNGKMFIYRYLENGKRNDAETPMFRSLEEGEWIYLDNIRPHNRWKPSDEQMEALLKLEEMHVLEHERNQENAHLYMVVKSIREQLLKLREE